ncbi:hypothetical protein NQ117_08335 [Paenibacillus sp. SC116]|uniref:hypothetical protein n=1 Tax=Paenibacillus sp. SC116 TaxID=2968986 RepID=UPI00215AABED|nr:hypothetical protein [Paenibacillus sp. SC116]MCR8843692.1 hypothetical protein [Paenibacillus sp. SC116]
MKKGIKTLLLATMLTFTSISSVSAAPDPYENPINEVPHQAVYIPHASTVSAHLGNNDQDWFYLSAHSTGQQRVLFFPPDYPNNQVYNLAVYEESVLNPGSSSAITHKVVYNTNGSSTELSFPVQAGKRYYVVVAGSSILYHPYTLLVVGQIT